MFWTPDAFLSSLIEEDLHLVDLTSLALGLERKKGAVSAVPKKNLVAAGVEAACRLFELCGCQAEALVQSGKAASQGEPLLKASGPADRLHAAYKVAQNVMEYSSGIAGRCRQMLEKAREASQDIEILVTRKHMPGAKKLSLAAALAGGASIHRTGLSDSILVFDQHREFIGGPEGLISLVPKMRKAFPERKLAAEANGLEEALAFAKAAIDVIQLERFSSETMAEAVREIKAISATAIVLAAGGLSAENAFAAAASGVDGLVTSWPYFGPPADISMVFRAG
ncbi:MAG: ModD protein [Deltaproteobacteria bacterium]|jgi:molybdenum transport protein|nr:ModD protein [Deltaproteobacteria bacterium]